MAQTPPSGSGGTIDPDVISTPEDFVAALGALRARAGLTVRELGRAADIPGSTIGGYLSGRHLPPPTRPEVLGRLLSALGVPGEEHPAWARMVWRVHEWRLPRALGDRHPFLGLRPFTAQDADLFFGRADDVARLARLVDDPDRGVVAVVGASGSGKTSLVRAGLLAALGAEWRVAVVTPGAEPDAAVRQGVCDLLEDAGPVAAGPIGHDRRQRRLLVVDQLEELWTLAAAGAESSDASARPDGRSHDDAQARALAALGEFAAEPGCTALVCLRSDFYAAAMREPALLAALQERQFLVGPLSKDEIAATVTGPASLFDITLTPGLVGQLVDDAQEGTVDRSTVLPHLSHTLSMMWERSPRREMTMEGYLAVGRIAGAVAQSAREAWDELPPAQHDVARQLLLRLVVVDEGMPPTAGALPLADITTEDQRAVLDHVVRHRLVVVGRDSARFAHEAVISAWDDLARWIEADRARLQLRRIVGREARAWQAAGHDPDLLLRGARLEAVREWPDASRHATTSLEADYISSSVAAADARAARERRSHRRTRRLLVATSAFAAVAVVAAGALVGSRVAISTERDDALSRQMAAEARYIADTDPTVSQQLDVAAYATADTVQARSMLLGASAAPRVTTIAGPVGPRILAASPAHHLLVAAGVMATVRVYDTSRPVPRLVSEPAAPVDEAKDAAVYAVALSPDASLLALAGTAGRLRILDLSDPAHPRQVGSDLTLPPDPKTGFATAFAARFTPDGRQVLVGTASSGVYRWEVPPGRDGILTPLPAVPAPGYVSALAVTSQGDVVTGTTTGEVSVWAPDGQGHAASTVNLDGGYVAWLEVFGSDVYVGTRTQKTAYRIPLTGTHLGIPVSLGTFDSWVNWAEPLPDRALVAFGSSDHSVRVVDADGNVMDSFSVPEAVTSLAYLGDNRLAVGLVDGQTILRTGHLLAADGPNTSIFFATWSGDGRRMAVFPSGSSTEVRLWDTTSPLSPRPLAVLRDQTPGGLANGSGDISPDGTLVVAGTYTGYLVGWDVSDPSVPRVVFTTKVAGGNVEQLRFTAADRLVVASDDRTVRLVALHPAGAPTVTATLTGATGVVSNSAVSPDGTLAAGGSQDGSARLYRVGTGTVTPVATIDEGGYVYAVAFTPDGTHLVVGGASKAVRVYDISSPSSPRLVQTLTGPTGTVYLVDIAADGRIAAASLDGTVTIWKPDSGQYVLDDALLGRIPLFGVDWAPDSRHLVAVGQRSRLSIWTTDASEARAAVCSTVGDPITAGEWSAVLPDQPYAPPCPAH
jgi:WD40 repeat protein/transcriptional regulator with XRE-family HTH domain